MTPEEIGNAIRAFRTRSCPACDSEKSHRNDPFCEPCVERLPSELKEGVLSGTKFIDTFGLALGYLRTDGTPPTNPPER